MSSFDLNVGHGETGGSSVDYDQSTMTRIARQKGADGTREISQELQRHRKQTVSIFNSTIL